MGSAHERFLDLALHVTRPVADVVKRRRFCFAVVIVLRKVVHDGVTDLDLLTRKLRTQECAFSAPEVTHDDAKLDVSLNVGYISPPKACIHLEHDAVTPIDVCIIDVLAVPKLRLLVHEA